MCAVSNGYIRIVHYLIEQKADITKVDKKGYNALHYAIKVNISISLVFIV